jgi:hypothetical protein
MDTELIIIIIICVGVILLIGYKYMNKNTSSEPSNFENEKKELKYFGGDYCPFSNSTSNAYKVIKDFEEEYSDRVNINYYWVGLDDDVMKELNVEYVPYLLNGDNKQIEIGLPEGTDASKLSEEELKELLLRTIYNKL